MPAPGRRVTLSPPPSLSRGPAQRHPHGRQAGHLTINKIPVLYAPAHTIFHDKFLVIDSHLVLAGSFNLTPTAEYHNAENLIFVDSPGAFWGWRPSVPDSQRLPGAIRES
jgi:phosphatidylserine/phosphatidylglycerophosphate/cardiolipin synthase-like enzyme